MGNSSPGFGPDSHNMESLVDEQGCVLYGCGEKMWVPLLGLWRVVSYASLLVCRQYASEQLILAIHGLNQLKFSYGDLGYAAQLAKLSTLWSEPQRVDLV